MKRGKRGGGKWNSKRSKKMHRLDVILAEKMSKISKVRDPPPD